MAARGRKEHRIHKRTTSQTELMLHKNHNKRTTNKELVLRLAGLRKSKNVHRPTTSRPVLLDPTRGVTEFWLLLRPTAEQVTAISRQEHVKSVLPNAIVTKDCEATSVSENLNWQTNVTSVDSRKGRGGIQTPRPSPIPPPRPPRSVTLQTNAPQDLDLVSWSVVKPLPWKMKGYAYDVNFGRDTFIYVIDNGLNGQNKNGTTGTAYRDGKRMIRTTDTDLAWLPKPPGAKMASPKTRD
ncbi:MAG: hypothetical protein L6R39_007089 [Caloplaca ligustica]|nr:MAG: hypothetical protein L6R39_007089 [Caloplaca ligustica]